MSEMGASGRLITLHNRYQIGTGITIRQRRTHCTAARRVVVTSDTGSQYPERSVASPHAA